MKRLTFFGKYNTAPAYSPKGDLIAFVTKTGGAIEICMMKPDGSDARVLTEGGINDSPRFSPCGRYILYSSQQGSGKTQVYMMLRNGDNKRPLKFTGGEESQPSSCLRRRVPMKSFFRFVWQRLVIMFFQGCAGKPVSAPLRSRYPRAPGPRSRSDRA